MKKHWVLAINLWLLSFGALIAAVLIFKDALAIDAMSVGVPIALCLALVAAVAAHQGYRWLYADRFVDRVE
jgi:uncharacterized membrane-anchored protein